MLSWALGVTLMPLAAFTAIGFTSVLFAVAIAALVLGEKVGRRRWSAVVVRLSRRRDRGSARRGGIGLAALLAIVSAVAVAGSRTTARALGRSERRIRSSSHGAGGDAADVAAGARGVVDAERRRPALDPRPALVTCLGHLGLAQALPPRRRLVAGAVRFLPAAARRCSASSSSPRCRMRSPGSARRSSSARRSTRPIARPLLRRTRLAG